MLLKTVLNDLINNELVNLSLGKPEWATGNFNYVTLIQCVSMGFVELHKRFPLKKEKIRLLPQEGVTEYPLDVAYALSNTAVVGPKFIIDTAIRPFSGNVVKIDNIYDEFGYPIPFNTTSVGGRLSLLDDTTLFITDPGTLGALDLICRALPPSIQLIDESALDTYALDLPAQYFEALLLYAAGRAHSNRGAENATNNESSLYFARFEQSCLRISQFGLDTHESYVNTKLTARGFV